MALDITISGTSTLGAFTYKLKAVTLRLIYEKSPIQFGIPGEGTPVLFDFGQFVGQIVISGLVDTTASTDGGTTVPSKNDLEDFVIGMWENALTFTKSEYDGTLSPPTATYGTARIRGVVFEQSAAQEDRWDFQLTLLISDRT